MSVDDDAPQSFYPGMWLRWQGRGDSPRQPVLEVLKVGRVNVTVRESFRPKPEKFSIENAKLIFLKVYESPPGSPPPWIKTGSVFGHAKFGPWTVRTVRWGFVSAENPDGVLAFFTVDFLHAYQPLQTYWERLT